MHRAILSSTQAARSAGTSRRFFASAASRNGFSSLRNASSARLPFSQRLKNKSTLAIQQQSTPSATAASTTPRQQLQQLSREQISSLFWSAAIPMVGFGFMDNFIMITAGSAIDNSLGVQFGLATMTAAAIGQVVSDVSGVLFGDTLANMFNVAPANLSKAQSKLKIVGRIKLGGAVAGMIVGCTLGACALWIVPEKDELGAASSPAAEAAPTERQQQERTREQLLRLQQVMADIMKAEDDTWHDRRASCTLYVQESMEDSIPAAPKSKGSFFDFRREVPASIESLGSKTNDPEVLHTLKEGRVVVFANTIYVPVKQQDDKENESIIGIFKIKLDNGNFYTGSEIKDAKKVARNLGFFLNRMVTPSHASGN